MIKFNKKYCTGTDERCDNELCKECCDHEEHEGFTCLGCGYQGDASDWMICDEDYYKDMQDDR